MSDGQQKQDHVCSHVREMKAQAQVRKRQVQGEPVTGGKGRQKHAYMKFESKLVCISAKSLRTGPNRQVAIAAGHHRVSAQM